jgi:hypothetical protein
MSGNKHVDIVIVFATFEDLSYLYELSSSF